MKRNHAWITGLVLGLILLTRVDVEAARGGGGPVSVGGFGSGAYRGGQNVYRVPTMSRASIESLPVRPNQVGPQAVSAPSVNSPTVTSGRLPTQHQINRNQANQVLQQSRVQNVNQNELNVRQNAFNNNRTATSSSRQLNARRVSKAIQEERGSTQWFSQGFFRDHHIAPSYLESDINAWRPATWTALTSWLPYGWSTPIYYDEAGYPIAVNPTTTSVNASTTTTPQTKQSVPEQWIPLGVFVVSPDANQAEMSAMIVQLALDKKGQLSGTYYNTDTDKAVELVGFVDETTQQAAWQVADRPASPFMFTGLYNLTEDQTPVMLHFSDGSEQSWTMTRVQD